MSERWQDNLLDDNGESISELAQSPVLDRYKTPNDAYKGLIEARATLGRSFTMPSKDATADERKEWLNGTVKEHLPEMMLKPEFDSEDGAKDTWAMLGVPTDGEYKNIEDVGGLSDETISDLNELSKAAGHTSKQHTAFMERMRDMSDTAAAKHSELMEQDTESLKASWGSAYDQNIGITDEITRQFNEKHPNNPLGELNSAARVFIMEYANSVTSDPQVFNQVNTPNKVMTPTEARIEMDEMHAQRSKNKHMTKDQSQAWIRKFNKLVALAG